MHLAGSHVAGGVPIPEKQALWQKCVKLALSAANQRVALARLDRGSARATFPSPSDCFAVGRIASAATYCDCPTARSRCGPSPWP
jgi:hypothetical protein